MVITVLRNKETGKYLSSSYTEDGRYDVDSYVIEVKHNVNRPIRVFSRVQDAKFTPAFKKGKYEMVHFVVDLNNQLTL